MYKVVIFGLGILGRIAKVELDLALLWSSSIVDGLLITYVENTKVLDGVEYMNETLK